MPVRCGRATCERMVIDAEPHPCKDGNGARACPDWDAWLAQAEIVAEWSDGFDPHAALEQYGGECARDICRAMRALAGYVKPPPKPARPITLIAHPYVPRGVCYMLDSVEWRL